MRYVDYWPQNPRNSKPPGKNEWIRAHWKWGYNHQWEWVLGH